MKRVHTSILAAVLALALPPLAHAATRYVADTGADAPSCGLDAATACRSISQAIQLAGPGDTILVGPGRYGDLNRSGVLGDFSGEETGAPGCGCAVAINKPVIVVSSAGAAVTLIDARGVYLIDNVLLITIGGEFGRPGKGFSVTETTHFGYKGNNGHGIVIDSANVMVRGNRVVYTGPETNKESVGILTVNDAPVRIEGNQVINWCVGIWGRGAATVTKNEVMENLYGILASGGNVAGNVATYNSTGISMTDTAEVTGNAVYRNRIRGFVVSASFSGVFAKNNMFTNGTPGSNCGVENQVIALKATNNYWGAATGPGAPPADRACDLYSGTTTTSPFATKPFAVKILKP
jgi:hypothetical protein